jgi:hypothetical protein
MYRCSREVGQRDVCISIEEFCIECSVMFSLVGVRQCGGGQSMEAIV